MGHDVLVATSDDPSDDELCWELQKYKINFYRGDLNNVLERFCGAVEDLSDSDVVVRLTADNVVPDGALIDNLLKFYTKNDCEYAFCNGDASRLPYGVSVEIFKVEHLRFANRNASSLLDLEHVTTYLKKKLEVSTYVENTNIYYSDIRATVDYIEDYEFMKYCCEKISDIILINYLDFVKVLAQNYVR